MKVTSNLSWRVESKDRLYFARKQIKFVLSEHCDSSYIKNYSKFQNSLLSGMEETNANAWHWGIFLAN